MALSIVGEPRHMADREAARIERHSARRHARRAPRIRPAPRPPPPER